MLNFLVILTALKHPNQWAVIKLYVKKELVRANARNFCQLVYIDLNPSLGVGGNFITPPPPTPSVCFPLITQKR